jgi:DTW domain-containing protein YfiP
MIESTYSARIRGVRSKQCINSYFNIAFTVCEIEPHIHSRTRMRMLSSSIEMLHDFFIVRMRVEML